MHTLQVGIIPHHEHAASTPLAVKCCPMVVLLSVRDTTLAWAGGRRSQIAKKKKTDQNLEFERVCRNESTVAEVTKYIFWVLKHHPTPP